MKSLQTEPMQNEEQICPACEFSTDSMVGQEKTVAYLGNGKYECNACGSVWKTIANTAKPSGLVSAQAEDNADAMSPNALRFPQRYDVKLGGNSSFANFTSHEPKGKKAVLGLGAQVVFASLLTFSIGFGLLNLDRLSLKALNNSQTLIDSTIVGSVNSYRGLKLLDVAINQAETGASDVWIFTGRISNPTGKRLRVPPLMLKNGGKPVQGWRYQPSRRMLGGGESFSFRIALAAIPKSSNQISLHFDEQ